jgi:hypothetical protein
MHKQHLTTTKKIHTYNSRAFTGRDDCILERNNMKKQARVTERGKNLELLFFHFNFGLRKIIERWKNVNMAGGCENCMRMQRWQKNMKMAGECEESGWRRRQKWRRR